MAPISVGDFIPDGVLFFLNEEDDLQQVSVHSLASGKNVILFGVLGAFIPLSSTNLAEFFVKCAEKLKSAGVHEILLVSVNDPYVMKAWEKTNFPENTNVKFLSDGSGTYVHALGLQLDYADEVLGTRSRNFILTIYDLKVKEAKAIRPQNPNPASLGSRQGLVGRGRGSKVRFQCHYCGKIGHTMDRCYLLHGRPSSTCTDLGDCSLINSIHDALLSIDKDIMNELAETIFPFAPSPNFNGGGRGRVRRGRKYGF